MGRPARAFGGGGPYLGCALQPLFVAGALDDLVTLTEADTCSLDPVLFPQLRDLGLEARVVCGKSRIVLLAQDAQKLRSPLGQRLDFGSDVVK
jgi:hypothetical protein